MLGHAGAKTSAVFCQPKNEVPSMSTHVYKRMTRLCNYTAAAHLLISNLGQVPDHDSPVSATACHHSLILTTPPNLQCIHPQKPGPTLCSVNMWRRQLSSSIVNLFIAFQLLFLDTVCWLPMGIKEIHAQSSLELQCAIIADTTTPCLQI